MARWRLTIAAVAVVVSACTSAERSSPSADEPSTIDEQATESPSTTTSVSIATTTVATGGLPFDDAVDLRGFAMARDLASSGFIAIADHRDAGPVLWASDDGLDWRDAGLSHNLPEGVRGPYRIWRLGDQYLLYAVIETDGNLLGEEPLVAISSDGAGWQYIDTPGIDEFFWQNDWTPPQPGGVTTGGDVAFFTGIDSLPDGTPQAVIYRIRSGMSVEAIDNPLDVVDSVAVGDTVLGVTWIAPGQFEIARFDGEAWLRSTTSETAPDLRVLNDRVFAIDPERTRYSDDEGVSWIEAPALRSEIRQFAWFGEHGAAGEVHPPFGTAESFPLSRDGIDWWDEPLPADVVDIRHLVTTEEGLFSVVRYAGEGERAVIFTRFART